MNPSKRKMYAVLAGVGISLGAAGIASAASTPSTHTAAAATAATTVDTTVGSATTATTASTATTATTTDTDTGTGTDHTPSYTSSVTIPVAADGSRPTNAELEAVATVSSDEATAAALASTPGTAGSAELKSVSGNVVWKVEVAATAGGEYDVIVDAGNSAVLATHADNGHEGRGHGDLTPSYTSSVTMPVATDGSQPTDAALQAVSTVTSDQATAAALANTPGIAGTAELKSVAGNIVWEVDVTATAGGSYDVIVDAGNSTVLDTHVEGGHHGGDKGHHADDATDAAESSATTG
jgi:uncharacterized membrane protein YkoI